MKPRAQVGTVRRVASTRMPTKWGMFEPWVSSARSRTAPAVPKPRWRLVLGDVTEDAPLLRIHSQCFTGEMLGSLRCDCGDQLEMAMRAIAEEGRGLLIYEYQEGRGIGLIGEVAGLRAAGRRPGYGRSKSCTGLRG